MEKLGFYENGLDMKQFNHIPEISCYNNNYYVGNDKDLLFAQSDDDHTTEWWLITGYHACYLGCSYINDGDKLYRHDKQQT